jgi:hypothetical protein
LGRETEEAYASSPFRVLSENYFSRFSRDPEAKPKNGEVEITEACTVYVQEDLSPLGERMLGHFQEFLREVMGVELEVHHLKGAMIEASGPHFLFMEGKDETGTDESFHLSVGVPEIQLTSKSPNGFRDGIVKLVNLMGMREAPILKGGQWNYQPRLRVRLGALPKGGSYRDVVFNGYNAVIYGGGELYALSQSEAIPELKARRIPGSLEANQKGMPALREYGLKAYAWLSTRQKFPKDDPVFQAHPEIRGALTWSADGEYTLCTSHPLVRRYLTESVKGLFEALPELQGVALIIGGEGFYHCHMRAFGAEKGHTNCERCEPLGAEQAVADLVNALAEAARSVNPHAEVVAWPYSAEHVWAADNAVSGFLEKLGPGTALFTEIEKSEFLEKPRGVRKSLWDYSIDLIGPGPRAEKQIATCKRHGIPVYLKSEPELGFEAPRLPQIPCMDRWADRAEALASCGADGAWVFPAFRPFYGTSTGEINKFLWWDPVPEREELLAQLASRIAGKQAGPLLREAWKEVSEAIPWSPELPPYYTGPYYLGPMHPMCASREAELPEVFDGYYLFLAEMTDAAGTKKHPTYFKDPRGDAPVFLEYYRKMEEHLGRAADLIEQASPLVQDRHRLTFEAEASPTLFFYRTARSHANFYESCILRDKLHELLGNTPLKPEEKAEAGRKLVRWKTVLEDELENTDAAFPLLAADVRLNPKYGGDHTFSDGVEMLKAKRDILAGEIEEYLPKVGERLGL